MASPSSAYLMDKLLKNEISQEELAELLANIGENEMSEEYSDVLEKYFNKLMSENSTKKFCKDDILE